MCPGQPAKGRESRQPKPGRERGHDAATIEHPNRCKIEKIEKIGRPGVCDQKGIIKGKTERVTRGRCQRTEYRPANFDDRFKQGYGGIMLDINERDEYSNVYRPAYCYA